MPENIFVVDAKAKSVVLTGWILTPFEKVVIRWIEGHWTINPNVHPSRYDANGNPNYIASRAYRHPGAKEGCLVAYIGNPATRSYEVGNFGIVGGSYPGNPGPAGQLWVSINDSWNPPLGPGFDDNLGQVRIQVLQYQDYLNSLCTFEEMDFFIRHFGTQTGITNPEELKKEISERSDSLERACSPSKKYLDDEARPYI